MELNRDIEARDKIIFGKYRPNKYKFNDGQKFECMSDKTLKELIDKGFADPDARKNLGPSVIEVYEFLHQYKKYCAHGYVTSADCDDYGLFIEGVEKGEPSESLQEFTDYMTVFRYSDAFSHETMYCYFD